MDFIYRVLRAVLRIAEIGVIAYVVLSWIAPGGGLYTLLARYVEPILSPFRGFTRKLMIRYSLPVDLAPFLAMLTIEFLRYFFWRLYLVLL